MNLDEHQTFVKDGRTEILNLDDNEDDNITFNVEDFDEQQNLQIPDTDRSFNSMAISEDKTCQTEVTFSKTNKKSQTIPIHIDDSDSDDDPDLANQSLNQARAQAELKLQQSFNEPGFANMAMQTLVTDEMMRNGPESMRKISNHLQPDSEHVQFYDMDSEFEKSHRSFFGMPGRTHFSRHTNRSDPQHGYAESEISGVHSEPADNRRFSFGGKRKKKKKPYNHYNGNQNPHNYGETKASILRKKPRQSVTNSGNSDIKLSRKRTNISKRKSASMNELNRMVDLKEGVTLSGRRRMSSPNE